ALTGRDRDDLVAFLESLTGTPGPAEISGPPTGPDDSAIAAPITCTTPADGRRRRPRHSRREPAAARATAADRDLRRLRRPRLLRPAGERRRLRAGLRARAL